MSERTRLVESKASLVRLLALSSIFLFLAVETSCLYQSIIILLIRQGHEGNCSQSQPSSGERRGTSWQDHQYIAGRTQRHKSIRTYGQFRVASLADLHVLDSGRKPTQAQGDHANSTQRGSNPEPFSLRQQC